MGTTNFADGPAIAGRRGIAATARQAARSGPSASTLTSSGVRVAGRHGFLLEPTTVSVRSGEIVVVYGAPGHRHTLLALTLGGRLVPDRGEAGIDQDQSVRTRQRAVALVDVPGVSDPDDVSALRTVVGEELALAGRPAHRRHVDRWLTSAGLHSHRDERMEDLPVGVRTIALSRLASLRPGIGFLVLALPERHGVDAEAWWGYAVEVAGTGLGVLATVSPGIARHVQQDHPQVRTVAFGNAEPEDAEPEDAEDAEVTR